MKKLTLLLLFMPALLVAQTLPTDEQGKVVFEEVVRLDSLKGNALYANARRWLTESGYKIVSADSMGGKLVARQAFGVYDKGYVTKKLHGKISYNLSVEVKEGKYRYRFSDFVFAYYKENRTSHYVSTGKKKALEESTASGWQGLWENHKKNTQRTIESQIEQLKAAMYYAPKPVVKAAKKEEW